MTTPGEDSDETAGDIEQTSAPTGQDSTPRAPQPAGFEAPPVVPGYGYSPTFYPPTGYPLPDYPAPSYPPPLGFASPGYQDPSDYGGSYPPLPPPPGYGSSAPTGYPQPYPGAYPGEYRQLPERGTNTLAIVALVTAIAGPFLCGLPSIVGLILGIVAMGETKRTGQDGHGIALAAVVVSSVVIALMVIIVAVFFIGLINEQSTYRTY